MSRISCLVIAVLVVLIGGVLIAGCTDSSSANNPPAQTPAITTTPSATPLYTAGDIVRSSKGAAETGWLILKYDSGSDSYQRAFIYRNSDGSWGYRVDSRTENSGRSVLEKVNTVKVTHVDPSQVPLTQPTVTTSAGTSSGTVTATSTPVTTTTTSTVPLKVKGIAPESGFAGSSVSITDLLGDGFKNGASVNLVRSDSPNITATNVNVISLTHVSCVFALPSGATVGTWDVLVVNPGGQSSRYSNGFTVRANPNPTATTTTTSSATGGISITSIDPTMAFSGDYKPVTVYGSNFKDGIACKLTRNGLDIPASTTISRASESQMQCFFAIPTGSYGAWDFVLTNTDGTKGTLTNGFTVTS